MEEVIHRRLGLLRREMKQEGVAAWYIPGTDPHQSEYLTERWQTRQFISGFTGSAGVVVVTERQAALWTDSRYTLQAGEQLRETGIVLMPLNSPGAPTPSEWLISELKEGDAVGVDAACISMTQYRSLYSSLEKKNMFLKDTGDLLERFWDDRPLLPVNMIFEHERKYAGHDRNGKIGRIRERIMAAGATATVITALDDLAWTFNLRGSDIAYNPVFTGYGLITLNEAVLFVDTAKIPDAVGDSLRRDGIAIEPYNAVWTRPTSIKETVLIDPDRTSRALAAALGKEIKIIEQTSIPAMLKAVKSDFEIDGIREAARNDGAAMVDFLFWLYQNIGVRQVTEYDIVEQLDYFRSLREGYRGPSFFPITGYNEMGAIVHRSVTKETALPVYKKGILLIDSGGHYLTGTTDITRTIALSEPDDRQRADFTTVLKGMIGLAKAQFPAGTKGNSLDALARRPMWEKGLDYGHGTGHGIGYFLNVHEGPMSIRREYNEHPIEPGMVVSNEPGLYRQGQYGIRTENMMLCVEKETTPFGRFLGFETLTLCPIDLKLIDKSLLTWEEIRWMEDYHRKCRAELTPLLNSEKQEFLMSIT